MDGEFDASRLGAYLQSHPVGYRPSGSAPAHRVRFQLKLKPACVADLYINRLVAQHSALIPRARRAHLPRQRRSRRPGVLPARGSMDAQFRDVLGDGPHPTSAGSALSGVRRTTPHRAHPHGRGEHVAGSIGERTRRAHPRGRGEHAGGLQYNRVSRGSSPQARGALITSNAGHWGAWFIPAGAGSTSSGSSGVEASRVHPRRRGEHTC